ncbi:MAG: DUF6249 domain-containing protein [Bacteroidales bacterium]
MWVIVLVALFASVFGVFYLHFTTRHRERMGLIEKGADASLLTVTREPRAPRSRNSSMRFSLKAGMLIIGTGLGLILSFLLFEWARELAEHSSSGIISLMVIGIIFIFGGLGLVSGYYLGRVLDRKDYGK